MRVCVYPSIYLSVDPSIDVFIDVSIDVSVYPSSINPSIHSSIHICQESRDFIITIYMTNGDDYRLKSGEVGPMKQVIQAQYENNERSKTGNEWEKTAFEE